MTDYALLGAAKYIGRQLGTRPVLFLVWFTSSMRSDVRVDRVRTALAIYRRNRPKHRFVFLCNEEEERTAFDAAGMNAVQFSANAFVDETKYHPIPETERIYDAIYNGSMSAQKRRHLARLVPSAAHIFGVAAGPAAAEALPLLDEMRRLMPAHRFLNEVDGGTIKKLGRDEVNRALATGWTGLCLSAREGAMFASIEYLLAGLPVVSTPALGGRHLFGSPDTWLTVADTAEAVRDGVALMKGRNLAPEYVRNLTLTRVYKYRARLRETLLEYTGGAVVLPSGYGSDVYRGFIDWIDGPAMLERIVTG